MSLKIASNRLKLIALLILYIRSTFSIICYECTCDGCRPKEHTFCHDPSAYITEKTRLAVKRSDVQVVNSTYRCYTFAWDENRGGSWVKVIKRAVMNGDADMAECETFRASGRYKNVLCQRCDDSDFCNSAPVNPIRYCYRCECEGCTVERDGDCIFAKKGRTPRVALAVPGEVCGRVTWTGSDGRWYLKRDAVVDVDVCERLKELEEYIHVGCDTCLGRDLCNGANLKERISCYECEDCVAPHNDTTKTPPGSPGSCVLFMAETSAKETIIERGKSSEPHYCHNISTRLLGNVTKLKCIECFRPLCNDRPVKPPNLRKGRQEVIVLGKYRELSPVDDELPYRDNTTTQTQARTTELPTHTTENIKGVMGSDPCEITTAKPDNCTTEPVELPPTPSEIWISISTEDPCATQPPIPPTPPTQAWIPSISTQDPCLTEVPPTPTKQDWIPTEHTTPCPPFGPPPTPVTEKWMTDEPSSISSRTEPWLPQDPCQTTTVDPCAGRKQESLPKTVTVPANAYPNDLGTSHYFVETSFATYYPTNEEFLDEGFSPDDPEVLSSVMESMTEAYHSDPMIHRRVDPLCYICDNCSTVDSRTRLVRMFAACYTEVLRKFQDNREWAVSVRRGTGNDPIGANFMQDCRQKKLQPMYRNVICLECKLNLCNGQSFQKNERVTCFDCYNCFHPGEKDDFVDTTGGCLLEIGKRRNLYGGWSTYVVRNTTDDVFRRIGRYNLDLCQRRKQEQFDFADVKCYTCHSDFCNGRPITSRDE